MSGAGPRRKTLPPGSVRWLGRRCHFRGEFARRAWQPSEWPDSLNAETYLEKVQPLLAGLTRPAIAADVSIKYAGDVRAGTCVPHPRHWLKLAELVKIGTVTA